MSTLDIEPNEEKTEACEDRVTESRTSIMAYAIPYLAVTIFCIIFQFIYNQHSHGVSSIFMTYAFICPLIGGILTTISFRFKNRKMVYLFRQLVNGSVIWLTLGSIFEGVLEIYGTTNHLVILFAIIGGVQLLAAFISLAIP